MPIEPTPAATPHNFVNALTASHASDPVLFAKSLLKFHPDPIQQQILHSSANRVLLNCTRQWGKSTICAIKALHHAIFEDNANVIIVSPSERQSAELVRKTRLFAQHHLKLPIPTDRSNRSSLVLPNGSRIVGFPASNERLRGFSATLLLIDEAAHASNELYQTVRPFLAATNGALWLLSTPNGKQGFFYDEWIASSNEWTRFTVSAEDCPRINKQFLAEEQARMTKAQFAQEYQCEFGDAQQTVFLPDDIKACFTDTVTPAFSIAKSGRLQVDVDNSHKGWRHFFIGLDLGQQRDHTAIAVMEQITFITNIRDVLTYRFKCFCRLRLRHVEQIPLRTSYTDAAAYVLEMAQALKGSTQYFNANERSPHPVSLVIDATGVGQPVIDMMRKEQFLKPASRTQLFGVNITAGATKRTHNGIHQVPKRDLITAFQLALESGNLEIANNLPARNELLQELARFERKLTATGYETFEAQKGHDDLVIALLLANYWASRNPPPNLRASENYQMVSREELALTPLDFKLLGIKETTRFVQERSGTRVFISAK